jgi:uncharacterized membrane protein
MRQDVIKAVAALITAAFGLVAALAWNTAIQEIFRLAFGNQSGVVAMLVYAVVVTIIAVFMTIWIGKVAAKAGVKEEKAPDPELEALKSEVQSLKEELRRVKGTETT